MKKYGYVRVAAATPELVVASTSFNVEEIISNIKQAEKKEVGIILFPELSITGYTCADLFMQDLLISNSLLGLDKILKETKDLVITSIIGMPLRINNQLFNVAIVINKGNILGIVPKTYISSVSEFNEKRWFLSSTDLLKDEISLLGQTVKIGTDLIFKDSTYPEIRFGIEIGEDLWSILPPSNNLALNGANIIFNLSSSNEIIGKYNYRKNLVINQSSKLISGYIYASSGINESTTDSVFSGQAMIVENGTVLKENQRFSFNSQLITQDIDVSKLNNLRTRDMNYREVKPNKVCREITLDITDSKDIIRKYDMDPFIPSNEVERKDRCEEIFNIQASGLAKRLKHINCEKTVIGISGGLDSTLAFLVIVEAYKKLGIDTKNIIAVTMPGFGTTKRTLNNSIKLMEIYGVNIKEISIVQASLLHMRDIDHNPDIHDITYENVQARERTQILMDIANKEGGIVVGTGDLSELALGWCTYNGDHMSMYAVNVGIPKTLVRHLVMYIANIDSKAKEVLYDILDTPISPELLPPSKDGKIKQKTENSVGPYQLHDFFLYHFYRYGASPDKILLMAEIAFKEVYDKDEIKKWLGFFLKRFFTQQFKRSCLPDGPKVGTIGFSPRGDLRMPSDASYNDWLKDL